ncbi:MAG: HAD family hydrolase [Halobacteriaceae archaeon]
MTYDAVVFDMDGVLVTGRHTDPAVYEAAVEAALAERGVAADADGETVSTLAKPDGAEQFRAACADLGVPADELWAEREARASELENERIAAGERALYDDVDALEDLPADRALGVVSNNRHATVEFVVDHFGLDRFGAAYGRDPTLEGFRRLKPDPHYVERALADLGATPSAALYVGDRRTDVQAAYNAGCDAALLDRPDVVPGEGPDPTHRVDSLADLRALL